MSSNGLKDACTISSVRCSSIYPEKFSAKGSIWKSGNYDDDMCQIDDKDYPLMVGSSTMKFGSQFHSKDFNKVPNGLNVLDDHSFCSNQYAKTDNFILC